MEITTTSPTSEPAFHADDLEVANYRTLSGLAIVSLFFGLAAPLCFAAPVFTAIPLFGVAVALLALRRIATSDGSLVGRGAAVTGLALCVASVAAMLGHAQATRFLHVRQAEEFGRQWIAIVNSGRLDEAFKLTVGATRAEPEPVPGVPPPKESPFEAFTHDAVVQQLAAAGADAEVRFAETVSYEPRPTRQCFIEQRFVVTPTDSPAVNEPGGRRPVEALLLLQRSRKPGETLLQWLVAGYQDAAKKAQVAF